MLFVLHLGGNQRGVENCNMLIFKVEKSSTTTHNLIYECASNNTDKVMDLGVCLVVDENSKKSSDLSVRYARRTQATRIIRFMQITYNIAALQSHACCHFRQLPPFDLREDGD